MKKILFFSLFLFSCENQPLPVNEAVLFAPGIISTEAPEFATTIDAEGKTIYFNRTTADRSIMKIMRTDFDGKNWSEAKALPFSTGKYRDVDPFLTADGQRLYFSSTRPLIDGEEAKDFDTWYIEKIGDSWSEPINPGPPLNSDSTEIYISMSKNGNAYFVTERDGRRGIAVSRFLNGRYQTPERIQMKLHGENIYASNPSIASDESFIIVASRDPKGNGAPDLFVSWNQNNQWTELQNLGSVVNSTFADFAPGLSKDDKTLFYSSERPGLVPALEEGIRPPGDIYQIDLESVFKKNITPE